MLGFILFGANFTIWIVLGFLIFGGVSMLFAKFRETQRRKGVELIAESLGIGPPRDTRPIRMLRHLPLFGVGRAQESSNVLAAEVPPTTLTIFDWRYTEGSGKQQTTTHQTVVGLTDETMDLPTFVLRPETLLNRMQSMLGFKDINFDEHPEFSNRCWLTSPEEARVRAMFNKKLMDHLVTLDNLQLQAGKHSFILFRPGRRQAPENFRDLMGLAYKTYELLREVSGSGSPSGESQDRETGQIA